MSERAWEIAIAVAGLLAIALLAFLGRDIYRAAATGPRWRRRLLTGGLALLSILGLPACGSSRAEAQGGSVANTTGELSQAPEWQRLAAAWREASEVASGRRGDYPFDAEGKKRLLASLTAVEGDIAALQKAGLLSEGEAGLLRLDLADLTRGVQAKRPTEMRMATCYKPMSFSPGRESLNRLSARIPLLARLAGERKLQPDVAQRVLVSVEQDIAALGKKEVVDALPETERATAQQVRDAAADAVRKLKTGSAGGGAAAGATLESTADWMTIEDAWATASPLARSGKSTTAQRKEADAKLAAAKEATDRLAAAGLLAAEESQLLAMEGQNLREDIYRDPPTDSRVTCYDMAYMPPAQTSLTRLARRLPLVEKLVASEKVHQATCATILAAMQDDLAVLGDPKELAKLAEAERRTAQSTREKAAKAIQGLNGLLRERPSCYERMPLPEKKPQSRRQLDERLAHIEAMEREGKLQPAVAALVREGIERSREEADRV